MQFTKNMKAGYQGRKDEMREKAAKLMHYPGSAKAVYLSKSAAGSGAIRPYKEGGHVQNRAGEELERCKQKQHHDRVEKMKKESRKESCQKFAMGGAAKIRHEEARPKKMQKSKLRGADDSF